MIICSVTELLLPPEVSASSISVHVASLVVNVLVIMTPTWRVF